MLNAFSLNKNVTIGQKKLERLPHTDINQRLFNMKRFQGFRDSGATQSSDVRSMGEKGQSKKIIHKHYSKAFRFLIYKGDHNKYPLNLLFCKKSTGCL